MPAYRACKGYIYILHNKAMPSLVKVGMTHDCSYRRARSLSNTAVPFEYRVILNIESESALEVERAIHSALDDYHLSKEFFRIPKNLAISIAVDAAISADPCAKLSNSAIRKTPRNLVKELNGAPKNAMV